MADGLWHDARILAVDDLQPNLSLLTAILRREGYNNVLTATSGEDALAIVVEGIPDLILLDLNMPGIRGDEVMRRLRDIVPPETYLPVVILTADANPEIKRELLALGAIDFITKPFDMIEVVLRVRNLLHTRSLHADMEEKVRQRTRLLQEAHIETLERLATAGEYRDDDTGQHAQRVGRLAANIGRELGLAEELVELIERAAPLHDVGKIGVPDEVLLKPGKLTEDEWVVMKRHAEIGGRILGRGRVELVRVAEEIALCHHERWDGSGYPRGLAGEAIPLAARIVAVADTFDALRSTRPYRGSWPREQVIAEIRAHSGTSFDPAVVAAFEAVIARGEDEPNPPAAPLPAS